MSYSDLAAKFTLTEGISTPKLNCPDVRTDGETLFRQSQLAITRVMHIFPQIFNKITRKVGVKYWLSKGRLLCAVRHRDFIPWCHVADISMLRDDYSVFLAKGAQISSKQCFLTEC